MRATGRALIREAFLTVKAILDAKGHNVVSIDPGTRIIVAVETLAKRRIGAILVINDNGRMEGIVSERDIVRLIAERGTSILEQPVTEAMTRNVVTCQKSATVSSIMETMTANKFRHLPVVDDGRVIGLISIGDVVKYRLNEFEREQEALREYISTA